MPDFENIEQYETTDPHTGKKRVIPIAPHSYPPTTYRPRKRARSVDRDENQLPPLKKADFEVVSVEQMEREFRRSASTIKREPRNPLSDFWQWILSWFKPKQPAKKGGKGKASGAARSRNNRSRSSPNRNAKQSRTDGERGSRKDNKPPAADNENANSNRRSRSRRRKPRSTSSSGENTPRPRKEDAPPPRVAKSESGSANATDNKPRRRKRNRRSGSTKPNDNQQDRRE